MRYLMLLFCAVVSSFALDAQEIMRQVDERDKGNRMRANMQMILVDGANRTRERKMVQFKRDFAAITKKAIIFLEPSDVKNTGFLIFDHKSEDDEQWLYLPNLQKTKRIASSDQSGSFMGSDFSYNDLNDRNIDDYNYKLVGDREVNGFAVWLIEATPKNERVRENSGYTRSLLAVRKDNFFVIRAINYETKKNRVKFLDIPTVERIDSIWQPLEMQMTTKQDNTVLHSTTIRFQNVRFGQELDDEQFSIRGIERGL
ncbi:hypothetical protein AGMMS50229_10170 [Campylobacterota bacterium]|nr:hypothetical protein AGMMS50229_10170 [Campylobacterota bacterium]